MKSKITIRKKAKKDELTECNTTSQQKLDGKFALSS